MLAHEIVRLPGAAAASETVIFFHGLLGRRMNLRGFAKRCLPNAHCQALLVDMRGHGDSHGGSSLPGPNTLASCRQDVERLVSSLIQQGQLSKPPSALIGHSFGGKLALEYMLSRSTDGTPPALTWILDSAPGLIQYHLSQPEEAQDAQEQRESVFRLLGVLDTLPEFRTKADMSRMLLDRNFSPMVANWMTTNVIVVDRATGKLGWGFDLQVVRDLFADYSKRDFVPRLAAMSEADKHTVNFLRAGRNKLLWTDEALAAVAGNRLGNVFVMPNAGHFLHASDPDGVLKVLWPSLEKWGADAH